MRQVRPLFGISHSASRQVVNTLGPLLGLPILAGKGHQGQPETLTPYKSRGKPDSQKDANRSHARLRGPGERANAQLKSWRILHKLRCCPWKANQLAKAILILQNRETATC
ncbi:IS5 family transposase ISAmi2 [Actinomadura sp. RB68]|uniref:IS5 family transposase ISAmi2 n=1 Tax=Actinomadura macrotermitis TaxID=2585200 RepID=A0A7K0BVW0_9ACTN|nr:IS5 family transposase ISAmi2 [Actinomadura macrotermitis]